MSSLLFGFRQVVIKEILHLRRDPTTIVIAMMIPMLQMTIFGYAVDFDVRHIKTVVVDYDKSNESREYVQSLVNTQYVNVVQYVATPSDAVTAMRRGAAQIAIIIPPDFARNSVPDSEAATVTANSASRSRPQVEVMVDGSDSQVAIRARQAVMLPTGGMPVDARVEMVFNPEMRSQVFMIPGLIGVILQLVTVSLTAFSLVREREQGTLEQLMVTPVSRLGLMLGKLAPYAAIGFFEMITVLIVGRYLFDVPINGSVALLLLLSIPFIIAALSLGLLISTIAQNQAQALQMTMLITMPSILMSGFVFPRDTMPGALILLSDAIPVTYYMDIIRGIVVRGAGIEELWPSVTALVIIAVILLTISTTRFRKSTA